MYKNGYTTITNLDYAPEVIETMRSQTKHLKMDWIVADVFNLSSLSTKFDVMIDKGTLDALLAQKYDPWNPDQTLLNRIDDYMRECLKWLNDDGRFLQITFEQPHFRQRFMQSVFDVTVHKIQGGSGGFEYFVYECRKPVLLKSIAQELLA